MAYGHEDKCPHPGYPCNCKMSDTDANIEIKNQAMEWLNFEPRSKADIAQKICDSINITYDLVKKKNVSDEMRLELFKELMRPPTTGF